MKRKLKKKPIFILIIIILIISFLCLFFNKKDTKVEKEETTKVVQEEKENKISLVAVGDVLIHESVYKDAKTDTGYDFSDMFTYINLKDYDLKYCNMESTIGGEALGISGYPGFNAPDEIGDELVDLGFNLIGLANNHAIDKGEDAILYSNSYWKTKDVKTAGSYSSEEERDNIPTYEENGIKYAFLSYTTLSNNKVNKSYLINMYSDDQVKEDIEKIKDKVDLIIVAMHWGEEYTNTPTKEEKRIAKYLSSLGVNLIIGTHPHVVQPIDYIDDTLVIYSLGNFISNQLSISNNYAEDTNPGIGLMVGMDIVLDNNKIKFENVKEELILAYAENSTNFKVIPFSNLNDNLFNNYKEIESMYKELINKEVTYD